MYIGYHEHSLDKKHRIFIPAKFRSKKNEFIVSRGFERCLYLFDNEKWLRVLEKFDAISWSDKAAQRAFKRVILSGAVKVEVDSQGRMLLPSHLLSYSGIKNAAAVIGMGDRIEIWDKKKWMEYSSGVAEKAFMALSSKLDM